MSKSFSVFVFAFAMAVSAEQVCKISYNDYPASLDGITLEVPSDAVSMSESVKIKQPDDSSVTILNSPAICFMIDNSGSMFRPHKYSTNDPVIQPLDQNGNRFTVTSSLVDSLYEKDPNSEVALMIFGSQLHYDEVDGITEVFYDEDIQFRGSYVKYTKLNGDYTMDGKEYTGYELIKYFLETKDTTIAVGVDSSYDCTVIKNKNIVKYENPGSNTGTDINLVFDAVRQNLANTKIEKRNQYNIFFSDGIPSSGNEFADGKDFPTTYTVFFHPDKIAPDIIKTMNENIKNNGYSSSNENSELWPYDNSSHDDLLKFMVENVLNKISGDITTEPINITINGKTNGEWIDGEFQFTEQFPLIGELTPFAFDIDYILKTKTSDGKELIDTIDEKVDFSVERQNSPNMKDSLIVEYWDRNILFYEDGKEISVLNEDSDEIELRFREEKIDVNYRYKDVEIVLTSRDMGDELTITLDEKDAHNFQKKFTVDFKATSADKGDNVLQISPTDEISAFFKNPLLPLDTLTEKLGTEITNSLAFNEAVYFDKDANGFVDIIDLHYTSMLPLDQSMKEKLIDLVSLPSFRNFEVDESTLSNEKLSLKVTEKRDDFQTYCSDKDKIEIAAKDFDTLEVENQELRVVDSVAPILEKGTVKVVKYIDKVELTAIFSEKIKLEEENKPLYLYHNNGSKFNCAMEKKENDDKTYTFTIYEGGDDIVSGDSANINFSNNIIGDEKGNWQRNEDNSKREITITREMRLSDATYYDKNADGHPDEITLKVEKRNGGEDVNLEKLLERISLPDFRKFEVDKDELSIEDDILTIAVKEKMDDINTSCTDDDKISVSSGSMDNYFIDGATLEIIDSMAPVIKSNPVLYVNSLEDDAVDSISVQFSEYIEDIDDEHPLRFFREGNIFIGDLDVLSSEDDRVTFEVNSFTDDISELIEDDSVNINFGVYDQSGTEQRNEKNIKRPISIRLVLPEIDVKLFAVTPYIVSETIVPDEVLGMVDNPDEYALIETDSGYAGCLIMTNFTPETIIDNLGADVDGELTIYDKVGNRVVDAVKMEFVPEIGQLLYIWNGTNSLGRSIGGDSFVAVANITLKFRGDSTLEYRRQTFISSQVEGSSSGISSNDE